MIARFRPARDAAGAGSVDAALVLDLATGLERMQAGRGADVFPDRRSREVQKRKRNPTVGSMLLRWKKLFANPLFTCENMKPA
jgi:hypothetical protein